MNSDFRASGLVSLREELWRIHMCIYIYLFFFFFSSFLNLRPLQLFETALLNTNTLVPKRTQII